MTYALMPILASAILITTPLNPLTLQSTPTASSSFVFTRVLPENNFVIHIVKKGETLKIIAQGRYRDQEYWTNIWNDNSKISDPDDLSQGLFIKLRVSKPQKTEELQEGLKEKLSKLHPQPVYYYAPVKSFPQSNYEEVYKAAGEKFGVPWEILYGIHYTETGLRNGEIYNKQGSGAQGPMQFMPGTFRAYAVSAHGDEPDINDAEDAIYSAANFLARHGSLEAGLRSYGGNIPGTLAAAKSKGYIN
ncbi:lytic murein transglycosylase [Patescibacteria group bacterium]|nr:lytic murein transglycosylase [Patescibacteria group bacterium]